MKKLFLLALVLCPLLSYAERTLSGLWLGAFSKTEVTSDYAGWMETQIRNNSSNGQVDQFLFRTGLLGKYAEQEVGLLVAVIQTGATLERRYALQHTKTLVQWDGSRLNQRWRLEFRDFHSTTNDSTRLRSLLRYVHLMSGFEAIVWDEVFANITDESNRNQRFIERNRLFLGVQVDVGKIKVEIGYLNQVVFRKNNDLIEHVGVINWIF
jgi:hypothetical protein